MGKREGDGPPRRTSAEATPLTSSSPHHLVYGDQTGRAYVWRMEFTYTDRCNEYRQKLLAFMDECIYPNESVYEAQLEASGSRHHQPAIMEELKVEARRRGPWNLFHTHPACWLLYPSDAADERSSVDLGGRRII